jgi:hypothetical protein
LISQRNLSGRRQDPLITSNYTATWPTTPEPIRWLLAATDTVGPTPTLAPASLAFVALALLFATLRHPALDRD